MIKFNPDGKKFLTYEESCSPAMSIKDKDEAFEYLKDYTQWILQRSEEEISGKEMTIEEAAEIAIRNLGYYSGYLSHEERMNFQEIFGIEHPIFGSKTPTPEEAFKMGVDFAKQNK